MFKFILKPLAIAALLTMSYGPASAITLGNGGTVCEGPNSLLTGLGACNDGNTFGDGGQNQPGPTVELDFSGSGEAWILGGVRGKNQTQFVDNFTLEGAGTYVLTLILTEIFPDAADFDATWTQGGGVIGTLDQDDFGPLTTTISLNPGNDNKSLFSFNAAGGATANNSFAQYKLTVTAVPIPAALPLLGGALAIGGFLGWRRKRSEA